MKNNLYITVGENELFCVIKNIKIKDKADKNVLYFFLKADEKNFLKKYILETKIIDEFICNEINKETDEPGYIEKKLLGEIESLIIDFRIGNIYFSKNSQSDIHYTIKYINKYFSFVNTEVLEDYNNIYNEKLVSERTKSTVEKYINTNFYKNEYIIYEYPEHLENLGDIKRMNSNLKILSSLFDKKEILVVCKSSQYKEKNIKILKKIQRVKCVIVNSFESFLYLIGKSYFVITDNNFIKETALNINKEAILIGSKTSSEIIDEVKELVKIIELKKKYQDEKKGIVI